MAIDRQELIRELERLVPSRKARAIYLQADDADLQATIELLHTAEAEARRTGHIGSTGFGLAPVARPE